MEVGAISNNLDIQSLLISSSSLSISVKGNNTSTDKTAYYAKKGEPMYMAEMDSDEDGTITLDEFRDYCGSKGMSTKYMVKMSQMASTYRTMQAENETIDYISKYLPNISPKLKQADSESVYAKQGDSRYNVSMDTNRDNKVTYKEYMAYCSQNSTPHELKAGTRAEETDNGELKITNSGKAVEAYEKSEKTASNGMYDLVT